ncbi:hypothetical protein PVIIG_06233 [Plasmodium vivax India VII]|uniref:VIR protein n=1 Tax=Plasmodium vivax India VII TaxID=1077284 RepID=A0A0J9S542_PLAVI|nr:hypothetical protein PVIIG_06233 [Plasmodium vivax India VII]
MLKYTIFKINISTNVVITIATEINCKKYPFLENVWKLFVEYNNDTYDPEESLDDLCDDIISEYPERGMNKYQLFCIKLLRNLWHASEVTYDKDMSPSERCSNINKWLYFYRKIDPVPKEFIKKVFNIIVNLEEIIQEYKECKYSPYEEFIEPEKILKLSIFVDNYEVVENVLKHEGHKDFTSCVNYINECATIYRDLNATYCKDNYRKNPKYNSLCEEIKTFNDTYDELSRIPQLSVKLADLNSPIPEDKVPLSSVVKDQTSTAAHFDFLSDPLKSKISTGIGFTPARRLFYGQNRGVKGNNFLDEAEINEIFHNNPNFGNIESDNSTYNIGYHNMEEY